MLTYKMDNEKDIMGEPLALHVPAYYGSGTELDIVVAKGSLKKKKPGLVTFIVYEVGHV